MIKSYFRFHPVSPADSDLLSDKYRLVRVDHELLSSTRKQPDGFVSALMEFDHAIEDGAYQLRSSTDPVDPLSDLRPFSDHENACYDRLQAIMPSVDGLGSVNAGVFSDELVRVIDPSECALLGSEES